MSYLVRIRNRDVMGVIEALNGLDGLAEPHVDGKGRQVVVNRPFKLSASTRLKIARNLRLLMSAQDNLDHAKARFHDQNDDPTTGRVDPAVAAEMNREWSRVLDAEAGFPFDMMTVDELNLDDNAIPGSVLTLLSPVLVADDGAAVDQTIPDLPDLRERVRRRQPDDAATSSDG